jgi:hypothetical protein
MQNPKVHFLKDISTFDIENTLPNTVLIYHDLYKNNLPKIEGVKYINFNDFKTRYFEIETNMMIIIGVNRIITPSNRCNMVNDYLQTMTQNIEKICVDTEPFIGEPWRLWYHYDISNNNTFNLPHGYAAETEWKHWFYRDRNDCRFSGENVGLFIGDTYTNLDNLDFKYKIVEPLPASEEYYNEIKKHVFSKYNSPKIIINTLLKECNKKFSVHLSFDSYKQNKLFEVPDLGIYRFVIEENKRRADIYNAVLNKARTTQ